MSCSSGIAVLAFLVSIYFLSSNADCDQIDIANVFIGSGGTGYGYGSLNPAAQYPFGAMRLGPDTTSSIIDISYRHFSGYNFLDPIVRAFSHTHLVGAGVYDLGNFGITPVSFSDADLKSLAAWKLEKRWWSPFEKVSEIANPGYYSVFLDKPKVLVELLAISKSAGIHRYTWKNMSSSEFQGIVIDVCHAAKTELKGEPNRCVNATINFSGNTFEASVLFEGKLSGLTWQYLYGNIVHSNTDILSPKWVICSSHDSSSCTTKFSSVSTSGQLFAVGTLFSFGGLSESKTRPGNTDSKTVEIRVGLSRIDFELAKKNLEDSLFQASNLKRQGGELFEVLKSRTRLEWCSHLDGFSVTHIESDDEILPMLHGAYYHTLNSVTDYTEYGGLYLGFDHVVHNVTNERITNYPPPFGESSYLFRFFSDFSLWDTFRSLLPWLSLINEDLSVGIARSMAEMTSQQQSFPRWVLGNHEGSCMIGEGGASFIADLIASGYSKEFDVKSIATYFLKQSTVSGYPVNGRNDLEHYLEYGYVSVDVQSNAPSLTLQYAFDDFILSAILREVGDSANADLALQRSSNFKNLWSKEKTIFCPKSAETQDLVCPKDPVFGPESWEAFTEGNAMHYKWFVPHDIPALVSLHSSPEAFNDALEKYFLDHLSYHQKYGSAIPNPYYWAGNEHSALVPWLFNYGSDCTNTQYWSRNITYTHFSNSPHGLPGNDDYGSMSSWLLFASLGLFPQAGLNSFLIGSPRVQESSIRVKRFRNGVASWGSISIVTYNNSARNVYVAKLFINGVEWKKGPIISKTELTEKQFNKLEFFMQSEKKSSLCN